ncbi:MAG: hypothetical protein ACRD4Q_01450 [Candidatus Acidiferrales bacterium]
MAAAESPRGLPPVLVVRGDQRRIHIPINVRPGEVDLPWRLVLEDGTIASEGLALESRPDKTAAAIDADGGNRGQRENQFDLRTNEARAPEAKVVTQHAHIQ